ncbi:hypothetical protein ACFO4N_03370 [Camelliibacillus cellulosilyticus]|uniref:YgaB-like protein n=1 Tax=Camelliibacillus cellulosilyticus TaxID=2174486 RepID=A0ABV9GKQ3_9BACL
MGKQKGRSKGISREEFVQKVDFFEVKMEQIERKISNKADEIVTIQLLEHRKELDEIAAAIQRIDDQIKQIDAQLAAYENGKESGQQYHNRRIQQAKKTPILSS